MNKSNKKIICKMLCDAHLTTREKTANGMLKARAILTRSGEFQYTESELFDNDSLNIVTVIRPDSVISHPETIKTARQAPITLDHPSSLPLSPTTWNSSIVGYTIGDPEVVDGNLYSDILICDQGAINAVVEDGIDELSIGGKVVLLEQEDGSQLVSGGISIDHISIVSNGRAGNQVKILDKESEVETASVSVPEIEKAVSGIIERFVSDNASKLQQKDTVDALTRTITDQVSVLTKRIDDFQNEKRKEDEERNRAESAKYVEDTANKLVEETRKSVQDEERNRFNAIMDATALLGEEKMFEMRDSFADMGAKGILATALDGHISDANERSEDFLKGALETVMTARKKNANVRDSWSQNTPAGVVSMGKVKYSGGVDVENAKEAYKNALLSAHTDEVVHNLKVKE